MMCLTKRQKEWMEQLLRRSNFLEQRIAKDKRDGGSWDLKELHALEWALECITFRYGDKPCSNCGRIKGIEHEEGCPEPLIQNEFKEALYGEDLTKLTKILNEDIKTSKEKLNELYLNEWIDEPK
jgi:hypothetical protein